MTQTVNRPNDYPPPRNRLLAALPRDEYERVFASLDSVRLPKNRILYEAGELVHYGYFPTDGMASLLAITEDGSTLEIGTVGSEGYIGVPILHQVGMTAYRVTVQIPMTARRMEANGFLFESNRDGTLRTVLSRYAHVVEIVRRTLVCRCWGGTEPVAKQRQAEACRTFRLARRLMVMSDCLK